MDKEGLWKISLWFYEGILFRGKIQIEESTSASPFLHHIAKFCDENS